MAAASGQSARSTVARLVGWLLTAAAVGVAVLTGWWLFLSVQLPDSVVPGGDPTHVRLVVGEQPGSFDLLWTTAERRDGQRVFVAGSADTAGTRLAGVEVEPFPDPRGSGLVAFRNRVSLPGADLSFEGDQEYLLRIEWGAQRSRDHRFRTLPTDDRPVTVLAGGDSLDNRDPRQRMNDFVRAQCEADPSIVAFLHGGDFVRRGERLDEWLEWLEDWGRTTTASGRLLPIVPVRGNHEATGPLFDFVFGAPGSAAGAWYVRTLGPEVAVVTLDSNRPVQGEQQDWLRAALEAQRARRWTLVQYHFELWPAIRPRQERAPDWIAAFEEFGVDLAIECNGHCVKRTVPILEATPDDAGLVYLGEGGLGARQRTPDPDRWWLQPPGFAANAAHVWKLRLGRKQLDFEVLTPEGVARSADWSGTVEPRR